MAIERGRGFVGVSRKEGPGRYCTSQAEAHGGMRWWKDKEGRGARPSLGTDWEMTMNNNRAAWSHATVGASHGCGRQKSDETIENPLSRKVPDTSIVMRNEGKWNMTDCG